MVIITDYTLILKEESDVFFVESNEPIPPCPKCSGAMKYRDSKIRICKKEGGEKTHLMISRVQCSNCHSYHNQLPDCLAPYKHYEAEVIAGVIDGIVTPDDEDAEEYPCLSTMKRWIFWFRMNMANMEGWLRNIGYLILGWNRDILFTSDSLLELIRKQHMNWLEITLRIIYNSGGVLPAIPF